MNSSIGEKIGNGKSLDPEMEAEIGLGSNTGAKVDDNLDLNFKVKLRDNNSIRES